MTLLRPRIDPTPVDASDAEALIKEPRRLRRRRWTIGLLVAAVVGAGAGWALAASAHGPTAPTTHATRHNVTGDNFRPGLPVGPYANLTVAGPLAVATTGALYVADVDREQILVRLPDGRFRVIAGDGKKGVSGDGGPAVDAEFLDIVDMAVGPDGSLYVVDGDRVRVVSPDGVISTIAGIAGMGTAPPCCSGTTLPPPIANGTPARSVSIDQLNSAAIALSEQGVLYISTGMQLLRLDAGSLDVITTRAIGPPYNGQPLPDLGQIAVDAQGNLDRLGRQWLGHLAGGTQWSRHRNRRAQRPAQWRQHLCPRTSPRRGGLRRVRAHIPQAPRRPGDPWLLLPPEAALGLLAHLLRLRTRRQRSTPTRFPASELGRSISSYASFATTDPLCSGNRDLPLRLQLRPDLWLGGWKIVGCRSNERAQ